MLIKPIAAFMPEITPFTKPLTVLTSFDTALPIPEKTPDTKEVNPLQEDLILPNTFVIKLLTFPITDEITEYTLLNTDDTVLLTVEITEAILFITVDIVVDILFHMPEIIVNTVEKIPEIV